MVGMKAVRNPLNTVRDEARRLMLQVAGPLNRLTKGKLTPNAVTVTGLLAHIPISWLIATTHYNLLAAGLLIFFGLFDTLDGALAKVQQRTSVAGMLLDATTDRMKEVMLYTGAAYNFIHTQNSALAAICVIACGASLCVSYVKAKGETAVKDSQLSANEINRLFADGLMRFEVRMFVLVLGLATNELAYAIVVIAVLSTFTAISRLVKISRALS